MKIKGLFRDSRGQGMTEYIIIVSIIAIAAIGVISAFGTNIRGLFGESAAAMSGKTSLTNDTYGIKDPGKPMDKTLKNFGDNTGP
jgi:Flp pilus assembly pilin Flp